MGRRLIVLFTCCIISINPTGLCGQVGQPVSDGTNTGLRETIRKFEEVAQFILEYGEDIYRWTKRALEFVNQTIEGYTLYTETRANIGEIVQLADNISSVIAEHPEFGLSEKKVLDRIRAKTLDLGVQLYHAFFDGDKKPLRMNDGGTMETLHYVAVRIRIYRRMLRLYGATLNRKVSAKSRRVQESAILDNLFKYN